MSRRSVLIEPIFDGLMALYLITLRNRAYGFVAERGGKQVPSRTQIRSLKVNRGCPSLMFLFVTHQHFPRIGLGPPDVKKGVVRVFHLGAIMFIIRFKESGAEREKMESSLEKLMFLV